LENYLPEPDAPSTLHGDLWSGNVMADKDGEAVIFDPACYYGHFEADLAMTELFGRFDQRFYDAYNEVTKIPPEYESSRCELYYLYHVLNHLNLFGSSYASQASAIVSRYV
jgi:fructosamine-3-kinase